MSKSIPGNTSMPKANIAWLPEKDKGYIGSTKARIADENIGIKKKDSRLLKVEIV